MTASLKAIPGSLGQALAKPRSPLCCHAPSPLSFVCFATTPFHPPPPLSLCLSIIVPLFSALSTFPEKEQLGCWSHRGNIFLTTLQIPLLYEN